MQISPIRLAALAFLFSVLAPSQQPYVLNVPIRAVAQDSSKPVPLTWLATESGIFRSTETGMDWKNVYVRPAGLPQPIVRFIHIDPTNSRVIYLVSNLDSGGIWKTVDGGEAWTQMNTGLPAGGSIDAFIGLPSAALTFYARLGNQIFKTVDGAATWTLRGALPSSAVAGSFTVNRNTPAMMFASVNNAVYRSQDEGVTWKLGQVLNAGTISSMLVDPADPSIVHMTISGTRSARPGLYRSTDGGEIFNLAGTYDVDRLTLGRLVSDPAGRAIYAGSDDDAFVFRTEDRGITWVALRVLTGTGFATVGIDPSNPSIVLAGTARGLFKSDNGGATWRDVRGAARPTVSQPVLPLDFVLPPGSQGRLQMLLRVIETSQWTLPLSAAVESGDWLKLDGSAVNTPATPFASADTRGLERGEYTGSVRVEAPLSANAPVLIPVKLTVVAPRPISQSYRISTIAGTGQRGNFGDNQPAVRASFGDLDSLATDRDGNIYVTDPSFNVVRRIGTDGSITRFAGNGRRGDTGDNGPALLAQLDSPTGLAVDTAGNVYIADTGNGRVRRVTRDGTIKTLVSGVGPCRGIAVDSSGIVYVAVPALHVIVRVTPEGRPSIFAGAVGAAGFRGDGGTPAAALLSGPLDVFVDARDRLYIADTGNHRIRRVSSGVISTVAGSGGFGYQGEGPDATKVALASPGGVAVDAAGNLYIADTENHRLRQVTPDGAIRTLAGTGVRGFTGDNAPAVLAQIAGPQDVAVDADGNVFSAEAANVRIRRLVPPPPPVLPAVNGTPVNWADNSSRLAPGSIFRLSGTELATGTASRTDAPWPQELAGAQVTLNGQAAPLSQVSPTEIVGMIPYTAALGAGTLVVSRDEVPSRDSTVTIEPSAPVLLLVEPGRALAANEDGSANSASRLAAPNSLLTVYFSGSGLPENPPVGGAGAGEDSRLLLPVLVQFGDLTLEPVRARLTPGRVGVAEVQFRVPVNEANDYAIVIRVGDGMSGSAVVSVGPAQ